MFWSRESNRWHDLDCTNRAHELGHTKQSRMLGWLYLPVVGLPLESVRIRLKQYDGTTYTSGDGSFGLNGWVANDTGGIHENKNWRSLHIRGGYQVPVFVDCQWVDGLPEVYDTPPTFDGQCEWQWHSNAMRSFCINRHNGFVNSVFMDTSVRPIGLKELWDVHWHRQWTSEKATRGLPVWPDWMRSFKDYAGN